MEKLIFIFLFLPVFAIAQIPSVGVFLPIKKEVVLDWDYEGVLTVGLAYSAYVGYWDGNPGSVSPSPIIVDGYNETRYIIYATGTNELIVTDASFVKSCNTIEIDGVEFTGFDSSGYLSLATNPFPAVGETCTIKLK